MYDLFNEHQAKNVQTENIQLQSISNAIKFVDQWQVNVICVTWIQFGRGVKGCPNFLQPLCHFARH